MKKHEDQKEIMLDHSHTESDDKLVQMMQLLNPSSIQVNRMEEVILSAFEQQQHTSLVAEWIELLRLRPITMSALACAGTLGLVLLNPTTGVLATLLG